MWFLTRSVLIVALALCAMAGRCLAADQPAGEKRSADEPTADKEGRAAAEAPSPEAIARWIRQLDADDFADREAASRRLGQAGKAAIPALIDAADDESLERSSRAMDILRGLSSSGDDRAKAAAKQALEKLAESSNPTMSRRAKEAIRLQEELPPQPLMPQPGAIAVRRTISVSNANGVRTVNVGENGRKIKIQDDPKQGIKVEVTETKNGKEITKTTEAKDAEELKKKDRAAYDLYRQYKQGGPGGAIQVQIQAGNVPGGIQILPGGIQIRPLVPGAMQPGIQIFPVPRIDPARRIEAATRQLQLAGKQLEKATEGVKNTEELRKALGGFREELQRQLADVEKRLKDEKDDK
jgi:hypothetical protein